MYSIDNLTIISSEGCNLNCSYCEVTRPQQQLKIEEIKTAFKNGSFLNNIKRTYEELKLDPNRILRVSLWGQEPTLTMKELADIIPDLFGYFPNINNFSFSTNGVDFMDNILYLIDKLNANITQKTKLLIQISHDGIYSTETFRGVSSERIINNVKYLLKQLNIKELNKELEIDIQFHGVLSRGIILEVIDNDDKILDYWTEWDKRLPELKGICLNKQVQVKGWSPAAETPVNASKEEGQLYCKFYQRSKEVLNKKYPYPNNRIYESMMRQYLHTLEKPFFVERNISSSIDNLIYKLCRYNFDNHHFLEGISSALYCGPFTKALKFRYDGTLIHCQNVVHLMEESNCDNVYGQEYKVAKEMIRHNHYPNIVKNGVNKENLKIFERMGLYKKSAYPQLYSNIVNLMQILREANQIDESYQNNDEKLLRHAFYLSWFNNCLDNEMRQNASPVSKHIGFIRLYCNGFMDEFEKFYLERVKDVKRLAFEKSFHELRKKEGENNGI